MNPKIESNICKHAEEVVTFNGVFKKAFECTITENHYSCDNPYNAYCLKFEANK